MAIHRHANSTLVLTSLLKTKSLEEELRYLLSDLSFQGFLNLKPLTTHCLHEEPDFVKSYTGLGVYLLCESLGKANRVVGIPIISTFREASS